MPEQRYYTVTQEREVKIAAESPIEAAKVADLVMGGAAITSDKTSARVLTPVRIRDIVVREDY